MIIVTPYTAFTLVYSEEALFTRVYRDYTSTAGKSPWGWSDMQSIEEMVSFCMLNAGSSTN
jgi:hypothetical protein